MIAQSIPNLKFKLTQAEMQDDSDEFIRKTVVSSLMLSFGVFILFVGGMLKAFNRPIWIAILLFPIGWLIMFSYMLKVPDVRIRKMQRGIEREIVFATRFLIVEIESGVPIFNTFINVARVYPKVGRYYRAIVDKINMGTNMEDAINEVTEIVPSGDLRKIFWQILNSIKTGADVSTSLNSVLEQIIKDQKISVEEYGRKLNPLAMFYMLAAVILPSLGITMMIIFATFIGIELNLPILLTLVLLLSFMQFMFYALIKSSRPAVDL